MIMGYLSECSFGFFQRIEIIDFTGHASVYNYDKIFGCEVMHFLVFLFLSDIRLTFHRKGKNSIAGSVAFSVSLSINI